MKRATMMMKMMTMMIFWTRSSALETTPSKKKEKTFKRGRRRHIKSTRSASPQNPHLKSSSFLLIAMYSRGFDE